MTLSCARRVRGLSLADIADRLEGLTGRRPSEALIEAFENGDVVPRAFADALNDAYGFPPGTITTDYAPRSAALTEEVA